MLLKVYLRNHVTPTALSMRCPKCKHKALFDDIGLLDTILDQTGTSIVGQRICPDSSCATHVFIVRNAANKMIASYPASTLDFDITAIPPRIEAALSEAINCHAHQCFMACAVMARKTIEALCEEKGASGNNLRERIDDVKGRLAIPDALIGALHELRMFGNDGGHLELKHFENIGSEECEAAIEIVKDILKAVYQFDAITAKFKAFKSKLAE